MKRDKDRQKEIKKVRSEKASNKSSGLKFSKKQ